MHPVQATRLTLHLRIKMHSNQWVVSLQAEGALSFKGSIRPQYVTSVFADSAHHPPSFLLLPPPTAAATEKAACYLPQPPALN